MANNKKTGKLSARRGTKTSNPFSLLSVADVKRPSSAKISFTSDLTKLSDFSRSSVKPISFGKPSSSSSSARSSGSGSDWAALLAKSASKGLSTVLGKGVLSFGINSLVSGFSDLFGSAKATPDPLKLFTLPDSQERTLYSNSSGLSTSQTERSYTPAKPVGIYNSSANSSQGLPQSAIVSAVKQALLTSSSLNDIIGEL